MAWTRHVFRAYLLFTSVHSAASDDQWPAALDSLKRSLIAVLISLVLFLFIYRMVLHGFTIIAVHDLSGGRATLIVLIIPMLIVVLMMLLFLIFVAGEAIGGLLKGFEWIPGGHGTQKKAKPRQEDIL